MEKYPTLMFHSSSSTSSPSPFTLNMMNSHTLSETTTHDDVKKPTMEAHRSSEFVNKSFFVGGDETSNQEVKKDQLMITKKGEKKIRKHRYAFQTRTQVDILDDGYRWRKYGQKSVKNNRFPRSYYRCTHQGCNVKKQVQRLSKDEGIVVTTYEGMHSHPIEKSTDNFEHILNQMQIYSSF